MSDGWSEERGSDALNAEQRRSVRAAVINDFQITGQYSIESSQTALECMMQSV